MSRDSMLRHSLWICWKDLLEFARSRMGLVMLVLMPVFMMIMVGFIFPSASTTLVDTPIAIADLDNGIMGDAFIVQLETLNNETGMMILSPADDFEDIKSRMLQGEIKGGIIITENFTESIISGQQACITVVTDQSNPQLSMQISAALSAIVEQMGTYYAQMNLNATYGIPADNTIAVISPYAVEVEGIVPGDPSYFEFMAPGIMAMVVMMALMTGLPHAISYEKDMGTLDGMLVAPVRRLSIILGKVLAQTTRGMVQGLIVLVLAIFLFGVVIHGSILWVLLIMFLTVFSFVGLGILITSFTDKEETASMVMMSLMFPMMFLSGVFFPIEQMPWIMQQISVFLPLTYSTTALRKVMLLDAGGGEIMGEMLFMIIFGVAFLLIAVPMFKKAMSK